MQVDLLIGKAYSDWGHASDAVAVYDKLINEHPDDFRGYLAKVTSFNSFCELSFYFSKFESKKMQVIIAWKNDSK